MKKFITRCLSYSFSLTLFLICQTGLCSEQEGIEASRKLSPVIAGSLMSASNADKEAESSSPNKVEINEEMATAIGGSPSNFFARSIGNFVRSGIEVGWRSFPTLNSGRRYTTFRTFMLPGHKLPTTVEEAQGTVVKDFTRAEEAGLLKVGQVGLLKYISSHEFRWNITYRSAINGRPAGLYADGETLLPAYLYRALLQKGAEIMRTYPEGILYSPGTVAVDTGMTMIDPTTGKILKIVENRSFSIVSGNNGDISIMESTKKYRSNIDGYAEGCTVPTGQGPQIFLIRDIFGDGKPVMWITCTCLDIKKAIDEVIAEAIKNTPIPMSPDAIGVFSAGYPEREEVIGKAFIIVGDVENRYGDATFSNRTGIYEPVAKHPILSKVFKKFEGNGTFADGMYYLFNALNVPIGRFQELTYGRPKGGKGFSTVRMSGGVGVLVSDIIDIPQQRSEAEVAQLIKLMGSRNTLIIDPTGETGSARQGTDEYYLEPMPDKDRDPFDFDK